MSEMRYDEQDLQIISNSGLLHNDANAAKSESIFFATELEHVKSKTYDEKLPNLNAARLFPVSTEVDAGADTVAYETYGIVGTAKIIANYADDLPRVDVKGEKVVANIHGVGTSYGYSVADIRAAKMKGIPLPSRKAIAARRANDAIVNSIAFKGDAAHNIIGVLNNENIPKAVVANSAAAKGKTSWADKTPYEVLKDMNDAVTSIVDVTNGVEIPDSIILPIKQYNYIANTIVPDTSGESILTNFLKNNKYIKNVEQAIELKGAGTAGADVMFVYRKDIDALSLEIPLAFTQYPPQAKNLEFIIPCESRTAGVLVYYPLSMCIMEGI